MSLLACEIRMYGVGEGIGCMILFILLIEVSSDLGMAIGGHDVEKSKAARCVCTLNKIKEKRLRDRGSRWKGVWSVQARIGWKPKRLILSYSGYVELRIEEDLQKANYG